MHLNSDVIAHAEAIPTGQLQMMLFGTPQIILHGESITEQLRAKAQALLFYLAVTQRPHNRDVLTALLWPEASSAQASKNLSNRLSELRRLLGDYLTITRQTVAFNLESSYWLDTELFREVSTGEHPILSEEDEPHIAQYQEAIQVYQGDFLEGFHLREAVTFEEWVTVQREQFRERMVTALWILTTHYHDSADYGAGIRYCSRLLEIDTWNEEAHRTKMLMLAESGQRNAALAQYETCRRVLKEEFGVQPTAETQSIYEQVRNGELSQAPTIPPENGPSHPTHPAPLLDQPRPNEARLLDHAIPSSQAIPAQRFDLIEMPEADAFYGRQAELVQLEAWIIQEQSRLVTILGIGGQGKTALAAQFVEELKSGRVEELKSGNMANSATLQPCNPSTFSTSSGALSSTHHPSPQSYTTG